MARARAETPIRQTVLDRLIRGDHDPRTSGSWEASARAHRESVRRDVEWLLNTRCTPEPAPESLAETRRSLYHYGLPDISSMSADSSEDRDLLVQHVQEAVELFEPRLSSVRVTLSETEDATERQVRFIIEATLHMDPEPEHVVFDTVLEVASAKFEVKGGTGA